MHRFCLNCGHPVKEHYCPNCGQSAEVGRLSWKGFVEEFFHTLTHAEKSIFGTTWQLIRRPGIILDEYIAGKRKKYMSPVAFFLVWVALSILTHRSILAFSGFHPVIMEGITFRNPESIRAFIIHGEWLYILTFPVSAALFYIILARPAYTYIECLVITMYAFSVVYVFHILCYLVGGGLFSLNVLHWKFYSFQILLSLTYTIWTCIDFFRHKKVRWIAWRLPLYIILNTVVVLRFLEFLSNTWVRLEHAFP